MQRDLASDIIALMREYSYKLDESARLVRERCSEEEFKRYRIAVGGVLVAIYSDIMDPIFKEHPDLEPDSLKTGRQ